MVHSIHGAFPVPWSGQNQAHFLGPFRCWWTSSWSPSDVVASSPAPTKLPPAFHCTRSLLKRFTRTGCSCHCCIIVEGHAIALFLLQSFLALKPSPAHHPQVCGIAISASCVAISTWYGVQGMPLLSTADHHAIMLVSTSLAQVHFLTAE